MEDKYNLTMYHGNHDTDSLRGFDEKESFAVFEVVISSNLSIKVLVSLNPLLTMSYLKK